MNNILPLTIFEPMLDLFDKAGILTRDVARKAIDDVNSVDFVNSQLSDAQQRLIQTCSFRPSPGTLALAINSTLRSAFPTSSVPEIQPATLEQLKSTLNLQASSGYPLYKKKKFLISDIENMFSRQHTDLDKSLNASPSIFSIFSRKQAKHCAYKLRLFFAPSLKWTVVETILGTNLTQYFQSLKDSSIFIGKTQLEIRDELEKHKNSYVYSLDYSKFDQTLDFF